jgi:F-type H+-transporting ATPase subunit epsilon
MARLTVEVVTPERRVAQVEADEVVAPGAEGLFGIRPGHTPYLSVLQAGKLELLSGGAVTRFYVSGGFAQVGEDTVRVLADSAEALESIDAAAAQKRVADAEKKLSEISPSLAEYSVQQEVVRKERVRAELAGKK